MTRRLIPLILFLFCSLISFAQYPAQVGGSENYNGNAARSAVCPPGANPDAGTSTQTLFPSAQSNNVLFLCLGDSLAIDHSGGDLSGDPQPVSTPGFSYVFYDCPPSVTGPNWATILNDPCHLINGDVTAVQDGVDISGDATFFNQGQVQGLFGGAPTQIWFAPITLDDFASFGAEENPNTMELGPCMNINVADNFSVTYLNAITGSNINTNANGNCTASFLVEGGLPEFDNTATYTNISVTLNVDPSIVASVSGGNHMHGDVIEFTVPQPGIYDVLVEDGVSCAASFTVDMTGCDAIILNAGSAVGDNGTTVCIPVTVSDFTDILSFQYSMTFDNSIIQFNSVVFPNPAPLNDINFGPNPITNTLTTVWLDITSAGVTLAPNTVIYEVCFDFIGAPGSTSPIIFTGSPTEIEVLNSSFEELGVISTSGSVTISGNIAATFTSCSSPAGAANDVGNFTLTAAGSAPPYTYNWSSVAGPGTFSGSGTILTNGGSDTVGDDIPAGDNGLPPGSYNVTVTDASGNMDISSVEIFDANQLLVSIQGTLPQCFTSSDGSVEININGGVTPYSITWSNMTTNVTVINNLPQGAYSATVTDAAGCSFDVTTAIFVDPIVIDATSLMHVTCGGGGSDGSITAQASGGTINPGSDFTYSWDIGPSSQTITGLMPGVYCVTATDSNGCEQDQCFTINPPAGPTVVSWDSISVSCPTDTNGSLTVHVQPENSPIDNFTWDPAFPGADSTITNLGPGTYYVTITAQDGCTVVDSATLFAPTALAIDSIQLTQLPTCPGDSNAIVSVFVSGGSPAFSYEWSNGTTTNFQTLAGLKGETSYTVTVTDSGSCGDEVTGIIMIPDPPAINITITDPTPVDCNGGIPCDGGATAIASGGPAGNGVYEFTWSSGETVNNVSQSIATQLCQGWQTITVVDGVCDAVDSVFIDAPPPLLINNATIDNVSCFGLSDGSATVAATGGTPGYTYQWVNPVISGTTVTDLPAGMYSVIATDANSCTSEAEVNILQPDLLVADTFALNTFDAECNGAEDGQIEVIWTGGNAGIATYTWTNNVSTTNIGDNLPAGTYSITVTDIEGCSDLVTHTINEPEAIVFLLDTIPEPECFGFQTFVRIDTAYGGAGGFNPPYSFSVDGSSPTFIFGSIAILAGEHTITVYDSLQCSVSRDTIIGQPNPIDVDLGMDVEIELGDSTTLTAFISGNSIPIDSLYWDPLDFLRCANDDCSEVTVAPLETTAYMVTAVDTNGCSGNDVILVKVDKNRNVFVPNIFTPDGDGTNDYFQIYIGTGVRSVDYFQVYDRWGEKLFERRNFLPSEFEIEYGWDGRFNGKSMNPGVFIYLAEVTFVDGTTLLYRGDVTLMKE